MGVIQNYEGPEGWERWKWEHTTAETHPSNPQIKGVRPEFPQPYPAMLYKVTNRNPLKLESLEVKSEAEQRNMESRGFVAGGPLMAVEAYDGNLQSLAVAAAERNYSDRNMSEHAKAEAEAVDLQTIQHLGEIPRTPIKKQRGRPKKETVHA